MELSEAQIKIQKALIDLIYEKGLQALTVSDITRKAKVNRGTFYLHYKDKQDLIESIEHAIFETIVDSFNTALFEKSTPIQIRVHPTDIEEAITPIVDILEYLYTQRDIINALVSDKGDPAFLSSFKTIFTNSIMKKIFDSLQENSEQLGIPKDYLEVMTFSSATQAALHWLSKEDKDDVMMIAHLMISAFIHI